MILLVCVLGIGIPFFSGYYSNRKFDQAIRTNSSLAIGKVYGYKNHRKQGEKLEFEFKFGDKMFYASSSCSDFGLRTFEGSYNRLYPKIKGKSFPVFFSKNDPTKYSKILITSADFKEYGLMYPDSLKWIEIILKDF